MLQFYCKLYNSGKLMQRRILRDWREAMGGAGKERE